MSAAAAPAIPFDPQAPRIFAGNAFRTLQAQTAVINDPANLEPVGRIALVPPSALDELLSEAAAAQKIWAATDAKTRAWHLHKIAQSIEDEVRAKAVNPVAEMMTREMGKPYPEAVGEMWNVPPALRYFAEMARDDAGKVAGTTQAGSFQYARSFPLGVSAHIMPYNFPILLMAWTVAASLAAGNAVVIKPAEATSLSTLMFMRHFTSLPAGLVTCVTGGGALGEALVRHDLINAVAFTGSVAVGRKVGALCGELMKPAVIEAGGNDAMIIMESAPVDIAAAGAVTAAFHLSGQICTSAERFFVHDAIHDAFVAAFVEKARALRIGHGLTKCEIGPLVSEAARARVMRLVEGAVGQGAKIATGGTVPEQAGKGWFYEPTILTDVTPDMAIMNEEVFGPVAAICRVSSLDEALTLANRSSFGLGASIFTSLLDEAMEAAERLEAGMVWVNNPLIDNDALPFGGWKLSGLGRELSRAGLDAFRRSKMVIIDHKPELQSWWYPYPDDVFHPGGGKRD
jgi:acyl-CoA reductase-like NAD-dependent aldehyde dehydrogenase